MIMVGVELDAWRLEKSHCYYCQFVVGPSSVSGSSTWVLSLAIAWSVSRK
jgi:hypothetical protein